MNSVLNNNRSEANAVIKIRTDEEKLIGTLHGKERVRIDSETEVQGHGLGGGQDGDVNFLQNTTSHYPPSQCVQRTLAS